MTQSTISLEEFLLLPEEEPALEFERGRMMQKAAHGARVSRLQVQLATQLMSFAEPRKLGVTFTELRVTFGGRSYVPDIAVIGWERLRLDDSGEPIEDVVEAPDIAIEIASPEQRTNYLARKCVWYVENGVRAAVLIDPTDRSVMLFRGGQALQALQGADVIDLGTELPGFSISVDELFGLLRIQ